MDAEDIADFVEVEAYSVDTAGIVAPAHSEDIVDPVDTVGRLVAP